MDGTDGRTEVPAHLETAYTIQKQSFPGSTGKGKPGTGGGETQKGRHQRSRREGANQGNKRNRQQRIEMRSRERREPRSGAEESNAGRPGKLQGSSNEPMNPNARCPKSGNPGRSSKKSAGRMPWHWGAEERETEKPRGRGKCRMIRRGTEEQTRRAPWVRMHPK